MTGRTIQLLDVYIVNLTKGFEQLMEKLSSYRRFQFNCKPHKDLHKEINKLCEFEWIFVEIVNDGKNNSIIGCIYSEFNKRFWTIHEEVIIL